MKRTGNLRFMQEINRALILDEIRKNGPISRVEVARKIGISPTTVTKAVKDLLEEQLIVEKSTEVAAVGRKPTMLKFSPSSKFIACIAVTETYIAVGKVNLNADIITNEKIALVDEAKGELLLHQLEQLLKDVLQTNADASFIGISMVIPGVVERKTNKINYAPKLGWTGKDIKTYLEGQTGLPVWIGNNVNAVALAEKHFGSYQQYASMIYVKWEEGIGAGFVLNNEMYEGSRGVAGELGHMTVDFHGPTCHCGNAGCLELYVGWEAMKTDIQKNIQVTDSMLAGLNDMTPYQFNQAVQQGDSLANDVLKDKKKVLLSSLVNLIHMTNPEVIVLGGDLIEGNLSFIEEIKSDLNQRLLKGFHEHLSVYPSSFGRDAGLVGAAAIALEDIFQKPI